jgi:DNA-binding IclR family transcriptional regulator
VATPQSRYNPKRKAELIKWVVDGARRLSEKLGYVHEAGEAAGPS